jgi:hypothetical protein
MRISFWDQSHGRVESESRIWIFWRKGSGVWGLPTIPCDLYMLYVIYCCMTKIQKLASFLSKRYTKVSNSIVWFNWFVLALQQAKNICPPCTAGYFHGCSKWIQSLKGIWHIIYVIPNMLVLERTFKTIVYNII